MAIPNRGRVLTGARAKLLIGPTKIGYVTNVRIRETIAYDPVRVLDNLEVEEFVPTAYDCSFSFGRVRIISESLTTAAGGALFAKKGGSSAEHLLNVLAHGNNGEGLELTLQGRLGGGAEQVDNCYKLVGAKMTGRSIVIDSRGVSMEDVEGVALRVVDEAN